MDPNAPSTCLVHTLERRHRLALVLVQRLVDDATVRQLDVRLRRVGLERQRVLHPALVVALGEVLARVGAARLLAGRGGGDGLHGALEQVAELEGLNEVTREVDD